jgi:hypothetical protein
VFIALIYHQLNSRLTDRLRRSESTILGFIVARVSLNIAKMIHLQQIPFDLMTLISLAQPSDPLRGKTLPTIDIAIPCHMKDFENLPLVIQGAKASVRNPVGGNKTSNARTFFFRTAN